MHIMCFLCFIAMETEEKQIRCKMHAADRQSVLAYFVWGHTQRSHSIYSYSYIAKCICEFTNSWISRGNKGFFIVVNSILNTFRRHSIPDIYLYLCIIVCDHCNHYLWLAAKLCCVIAANACRALHAFIIIMVEITSSVEEIVRNLIHIFANI